MWNLIVFIAVFRLEVIQRKYYGRLKVVNLSQESKFYCFVDQELSVRFAPYIVITTFPRTCPSPKYRRASAASING